MMGKGLKRLLIISLVFVFAISSVFAETRLDRAKTDAANETNLIMDFIGNTFVQIYNEFSSIFDVSMENMKDKFIPFLIGQFILLELTWICIQVLATKEMPLSDMLLKLFVTIVIIWFVFNLQTVMNGIRTIFSTGAVAASDKDLGFFASSSKYGFGISPKIFTEGTKALMTPIEEVASVLSDFLSDVAARTTPTGWGTDKINYITYFSSYFLPIVPAILLCRVVSIILMVFICFTNFNVIMYFIEFNFLLVVGMMCLPWQIFSPTKFMANGLWQTLFGQCIKIFAVTFLVSIGNDLMSGILNTALEPFYETLNNLPLTSSGTFDINNFNFPFSSILMACIGSIITTACYCLLILKGPSIAYGILSGTPTLETYGSGMMASMGATAVAGARGIAAIGSGFTGKALGRAAGGLATIGKYGAKKAYQKTFADSKLMKWKRRMQGKLHEFGDKARKYNSEKFS